MRNTREQLETRELYAQIELVLTLFLFFVLFYGISFYAITYATRPEY